MSPFRFQAQALIFLLWLTSPSAQASILVSSDFRMNVSDDTPANKEFRKGVNALIHSKLNEAEKAFLASTKLDPRNPAPFLGLADIELKRNQRNKASRWLDAADKAKPGSAQVKLAWGRFYRNQKNDVLAETRFRESITITPSASAYLELAQLYLANKKNLQAALDTSKKAVALSPTNPSAHSILAISLSANGFGNEAIQEFEQAARLAPEDPDPWRAIGRLHAEKNRFSLAASALDKGIKIQPLNYDLLVDRGDVAMAQNKLGEATRYYEVAAKQSAASAPLFTKLGWLYYISSQPQRSENAYKKAIQLEPNLPDAYNNLAWVILSSPGRQNEALKLSEKANQIGPGNPVYADTLGWIYHLNGDDTKAEQILRKAIGYQPELADIHHHLGLIYVTQGRKKDAVSAFTRALELNPKFTYATDAKKNLAKLSSSK